MFGDILSGLGSFGGSMMSMASGFDAGEDELRKVLELYGKIQTPNFDTRQLQPYELELVGKYFPESYDFAAPGAPQTLGEGGVGRDTQLQNLEYLNRIRDEGLPQLDKMAAEKAASEMSAQNRRHHEALMEEMQRRGRGGGGMEQRMRLAANQTSSDLARGMGQDLQKNAIMARLQAASEGGRMGGALESQDMQRQGQNADIWNRWNQYLSEGMTQQNMNQAAMANQGQLTNLGESQRISDANQDMRNQALQYNQQYPNQMKQADFSNQMEKVGGQAGALGNLSQNLMLQQTAKADTLQSMGSGLGRAAGGAIDFGMSGGGYGSSGINTGQVNFAKTPLERRDVRR